MKPQARDIVVTGRVQGVGYRPFVYVTAVDLGLTGTVLNGSGKVFIHAEGAPEQLDRLQRALVESAPPLARPQLASSAPAEHTGAMSFEILASDAATEADIHVPPDLFTCDDCLAELADPAERRHGYPFINCTQCGPRYTIITAMPYDRPNTSMAGFPLCDACRAEYLSPLDRRFHAQPLACPECGPSLEYLPSKPGLVGAGLARDKPTETATPFASNARSNSALQQAIGDLNRGAILAVKGVGGYHLLCDAADDAAVGRLRERKRRPHKPLAVMFPLSGDDGLAALRDQLHLDTVTQQAIADPVRPIVLARKGPRFALSEALAPGLSELGVFLPYSPLHHELLGAFGRPLVATSGNISGEPVITDNAEAEQRLGEVVDGFLHHDRPIVRPADDSVVRIMEGAPRAIRLGRGLAPLERELPLALPRAVLATGGHLKVTVGLGWAQRAVVSPHVGELDSPRSIEVFGQVLADLQSLYGVDAEVIVCDRHPGYASTRWARAQGLPCIEVQHHAAHASALAGEHPEVANWLVFTWDGVGYGDDGTLWGGEALAGRPGAWRRRASFRSFRLVGGDSAGREPWRSAAALLWEVGEQLPIVGAGLARELCTGTATPFASDARSNSAIVGAGLAREGQDDTASTIASNARSNNATFGAGLAREQVELAHQAWQKNLNTFESTAVGRLFDAAAALVLGRQVASFEGQGPMELEHIAAGGAAPVRLPLSGDDAGLLRSDWEPLLAPLSDATRPAAERAGLFHESMAHALLDQARALRGRVEFEAVGLSGGVFQNRLLTERVVQLLQAEGFEVRLHREVPANDGGLAFGQLVEVAAKL